MLTDLWRLQTLLVNKLLVIRSISELMDPTFELMVDGREKISIVCFGTSFSLM